MRALAAQQFSRSPTNSFPSNLPSLCKRRLLAWPPCTTSLRRRQRGAHPCPSACHVCSSSLEATTTATSALKQITQPFEHHIRPEQSSLPSALILEPGEYYYYCNQASSISSTRKWKRRLTRLMETPGCSTASLLRFAFGAPFSFSPPQETTIVVVKLFRNTPKPVEQAGCRLVLLRYALCRTFEQCRSSGRTDEGHGFLARRRCNSLPRYPQTPTAVLV